MALHSFAQGDTCKNQTHKCLSAMGEPDIWRDAPSQERPATTIARPSPCTAKGCTVTRETGPSPPRPPTDSLSRERERCSLPREVSSGIQVPMQSRRLHNPDTHTHLRTRNRCIDSGPQKGEFRPRISLPETAVPNESARGRFLEGEKEGDDGGGGLDCRLFA